MKTKKILLFIGGLLLMFTLSACSLFRGSRANIEKQFEVLSEIYPTKNVNDLREKFPKGFRLVNIRNKGDMTYSVILENEGSSNDIKGVFKVRQTPKDIGPATILLEVEIKVDNEGNLLPQEEIPVKYTNEFDNFTFLFEKLELSKGTVSTFKYHTHSNYYISYKLDKALLSPSKFNGLEEEQLLSLSGNFAADKKGIFEKTITISSGNNRISEWIQSKGTNNHE